MVRFAGAAAAATSGQRAKARRCSSQSASVPRRSPTQPSTTPTSDVLNSRLTGIFGLMKNTASTAVTAATAAAKQGVDAAKDKMEAIRQVAPSLPSPSSFPIFKEDYSTKQDAKKPLPPSNAMAPRSEDAKKPLPPSISRAPGSELKQLTAMGFSEVHAKKALATEDGNLEAAVARLCELDARSSTDRPSSSSGGVASDFLMAPSAAGDATDVSRRRQAVAEATERRIAEAKSKTGGTMDDWRRERAAREMRAIPEPDGTRSDARCVNTLSVPSAAKAYPPEMQSIEDPFQNSTAEQDVYLQLAIAQSLGIVGPDSGASSSSSSSSSSSGLCRNGPNYGTASSSSSSSSSGLGMVGPNCVDAFASASSSNLGMFGPSYCTAASSSSSSSSTGPWACHEQQCALPLPGTAAWELAQSESEDDDMVSTKVATGSAAPSAPSCEDAGHMDSGEAEVTCANVVADSATICEGEAASPEANERDGANMQQIWHPLFAHQPSVGVWLLPLPSQQLQREGANVKNYFDGTQALPADGACSISCPHDDEVGSSRENKMSEMHFSEIGIAVSEQSLPQATSKVLIVEGEKASVAADCDESVSVQAAPADSLLKHTAEDFPESPTRSGLCGGA